MKSNIKHIAFLAPELAGYTAACQCKLKELFAVELLVIHWPIAKEAPFQDTIFSHIDHRYDKGNLSLKKMIALLKEFNPQAIVISGWMDKDYLKIAKAMRRQGIPVIAGCDTQWKGSIRQRIGQLIAPFYLHPSIDVMWATGERQKKLVRRLGYRNERCWTGYYACDWEKFRIHATRSYSKARKAFFYVGRYIPRKGIDLLVEAYQQYRQKSKDPWELWTAGTGSEAHLLEGIEGIKNLGFTQPNQLPGILQEVGAFVLPSRVEPWGVVVQEAAAAGLPLICSDACGASDHLLKHNSNGFLFENGNVEQLSDSLVKIASLSSEKWENMSQLSFELSKQYTPEIWAKTLIEGVIKLTTKVT